MRGRLTDTNIGEDTSYQCPAGAVRIRELDHTRKLTISSDGLTLFVGGDPKRRLSEVIQIWSIDFKRQKRQHQFTTQFYGELV